MRRGALATMLFESFMGGPMLRRAGYASWILVLFAAMACGSSGGGPGPGPDLFVPADDGKVPELAAGDPGLPPEDVAATDDDPGAAGDEGTGTDESGVPTDLGPSDPGPSDPGGADVPEPDPGVPDPGAVEPDDAVTDAASDEPDTSLPDLVSPDAGPGLPLAGFGAITGDCGVLDDGEWLSSDPFLYRNAIDFGSQAYDLSLLSEGGQKVVTDDNLGGSSVKSEAIAVDVLHRCELATLLKTERWIDYLDANGKKTDELVTIDGRKVGVSVVRAYHYPPSNPYTEAEASAKLTGKLDDILKSSKNAAPGDAWERSILSVIAWDDQYADVVVAAWGKIDPAIRASTIVVVTSTHGEDGFLYQN